MTSICLLSQDFLIVMSELFRFDEVRKSQQYDCKWSKILNPGTEAFLMCQDNWTLRLLAGKAVELGFVDSISPETIRQLLKKMS